MKIINQKIQSVVNGLIFFSCIFTFVSCKKSEWFDVKSNKALAVPATLKDMQALLDNPLVINTFMPGLGELGADGHYVSDVRAATLTGTARNAYSWSKEQPYLGVLDWSNGATSGSYARVYYANLVMDGIVKIKPIGNSAQIDKNNIEGQALFHRAHAFFELSQIFSPPYDAGNAALKLGIPLRLESDINIPSKRSTVQQTYDQVINDLLLAKELLPESPIYRSRPSKQAVNALLARVYLSMENYAQAEVYANLVLSSFNTLLDYKSLIVTGTNNPFASINSEIIFYCYMAPYPTVMSFSNLLIDKSLYDSYSNNDVRKKAFFNLTVGTNLVTYKGTYSGNGFAQCFSGLATDEIYLIRAESYARNGKVSEAIADLNTLYKMRWDPNVTMPAKPYVDITATDKDDALRKILEERRKELILRGVRWSDLRRLNRDPRFAITLTRNIGNVIYTLEPNSYKYTFPIPDDIIEKTGMEQNPGWK